MLRRKSLLSVAFATLVGLLAAGWAFAADARYTTPEAAITAYIDGVARQDFMAVLAATSAEDASKKFDFVRYNERFGYLNYSTPAPASGPIFVEINRAVAAGNIAKQVQFLVYGLMTTREILNGDTIKIDATEAARFMSAVAPSRLNGLKLVKVGIPNPKFLNGEAYQATIASNAKVKGADVATERVALLSFEGLHFLVSFSLLRYGENWTVDSQHALSLRSMSVLGAPKRVTPEEFEEMLK